MTAAAVADAATNGVAAVEPAPVAEEKVSSPAAAEAIADQTSVAEGRRLYLGNVAYAATEEALKEFFKEFDVKSISIPKNPHTKKSVGYAFVDVATPEEAQRAIAELDRKQILERKVSVQIARPPQESSGDNAESGAASGRAGGRTRRRPQGKKSAAATEGAEAATEATEGAAAPAKAKPAKSGSPKRKTHKGPPSDGVQSKVKVMVTNLPYNLTEDQLKDLFKEFKPVSAKVALRPIPSYMIKKLHARGEARKGRGFGFVTLETEELQKKAIDEMNNKEVEGRHIEVKVAIDSPDKVERASEDGEKKEEVKEEAAPAVEAATAAAA